MKKMKHITSFLFVIIIVILTLLSCRRQNDNSIEGKVIGYEYCSSEMYGYLIEVQSPAGIGGRVRLYDTEYVNVVKTYSKPENDLHVGDEIKGIYQIMADSSICGYCQDIYLTYNVPEVIIKYK
ncbi:MAG: hypothetical protein IKN99_09155 [Bacteroidales bacterium]|jgi:hypothetical protein|nr:hypothetical protein [Bacteroidales bacterium]